MFRAPFEAHEEFHMNRVRISHKLVYFQRKNIGNRIKTLIAKRVDYHTYYKKKKHDMS